METNAILEQIDNLSVEEKMLIMEKTLKSIREKEIKGKMTKAVSEMMEEYKSNKELTVFSEIDFENFYETR
ncbi:MAG: hypothetical protein Q8Q47_01910 [Ignavibacteriaceae bacterium]|jgi:hypothetical protein|nr:hypothetical protein [Ignavibacteriaceae bacterium]